VDLGISVEISNALDVHYHPGAFRGVKGECRKDLGGEAAHVVIHKPRVCVMLDVADSVLVGPFDKTLDGHDG